MHWHTMQLLNGSLVSSLVQLIVNNIFCRVTLTEVLLKGAEGQCKLRNTDKMYFSISPHATHEL